MDKETKRKDVEYASLIERTLLTYKTKFGYQIEAKRMLVKALDKISKNKKEIRILIAGSGKGYDLIYLTDVFRKNEQTEYQVDLYEIIEDNINRAKLLLQKLGYEKLKNVEVETILGDLLDDVEALHDTYDIIVCSEVVEHLWDYEKEILFVNFNKYLKKGGSILITTPQENIFKAVYYKNSYVIDKIFRNDIQTRVENNFATKYGHKGITSPMKIKSLLYRKGFDYVKIKGVSIFSDFFTISKKNYLFILISHILSKTILLFSAGIFVIAQKKRDIDKEKWYNRVTTVTEAH